MKQFIRFAVVAGVAFCANTIPTFAAAVVWPISSGGNGHYYTVISVPGGISWTDAQNAAVAAGGYLATLTSAAENSFVFTLVDNAIFWNPGLVNGVGPWLGGFQRSGSVEPAGGWQWLNGDGDFSFTNWTSDSPNNGAGGFGPEDKLNFWSSNQPNGRAPFWNDLSNVPTPTPVISYVVESNVPEPTISILLLSSSLCLLSRTSLRRNGSNG